MRPTTPPANLFDSQPAWSPDGRQLVFVRQEASPDVSDIWAVGADAPPSW